MYKQQLFTSPKEEYNKLFIKQNDDLVSFDTYFNCFNVSTINKYFQCKKVTLLIKYSGCGRIQLVNKDVTNEQIIHDVNLSIEKNEYIFEFNPLDYQGIIYLQFYKNKDFKILDFIYTTDTIENKQKVSIVICTYKREQYVLENIKRLEQCKNVINNVIVVDNGQTLSESLNNNFIKIIPNNNLGGSGGFTRGMIEASKTDSSHIFLMDDDIEFIPEVIIRACCFISNLSDDYKDSWLGFSMFPNDNPTNQFELGCRWSGIKMKINNHNLDLTSKDNLINNITDNVYNYSAWWGLIMPISVINKYNYPIPFFIKFDDIEYGLRRKNEEIILTNGFGVWHEAFKNKYNASLEYYLCRNSLISSSLHIKNPLIKSSIRYLGKSVKSYFKKEFIQMKLINKGMNDFFVGVDFFINNNPVDINNNVRLLANKKMHVLINFIYRPFVTLFYLFKLIFKFNKAKKNYKNNIYKITSREYWESLF